MSPPWILVVDDDEDIRTTLSVLLDMKGYAVVEACDGLDALEQLRLHGVPSVILLDLRMPRMSGQEFAAALRHDPALAGAAIIVFSGDPNASEVAAAVGAQGLLKKPVDVATLLSIVGPLVPAASS